MPLYALLSLSYLPAYFDSKYHRIAIYFSMGGKIIKVAD